MELRDMARDKNLTDTDSTQPSDSKGKFDDSTGKVDDSKIDSSKDGSMSQQGEKGSEEKTNEILESIKELTQTSDENIAEIKSLMDKIDGALS